MNGATCINNGNGEYVCVCKRGFEGMRCERYNPYSDSEDDYALPEVISSTTLKMPEPAKECENGGLCKIYAMGGGCKR